MLFFENEEPVMVSRFSRLLLDGVHTLCRMIPRSRLRMLLIVTAGLWMGACSGCRLFDSGWGLARGPVEDERFGLSAGMLGADLWRPNTTWSPLHELPEVPLSDAGASLCRWLHPGIREALKSAEGEGLISAAARRNAEATASGLRGASADPDLNAWFSAVAKHNDLAGWNASILWARYDPAAAREATDMLARLVLQPPRYKPEERPVVRGQSVLQNTSPAKPLPTAKPEKVQAPVAPIEISSNMRLAAAEAWCRVLAAADGDPEAALAPAGRALQEGRLPAKVADELYRGIARRVRPDHIPGFSRALEDPDESSPRAVETRRAAGDACVVHAVALRLHGDVLRVDAAAAAELRGDDAEALAAAAGDDAPWPAGFWRARHDGDPRLRKRVGELVAVTRHPAAFEVLKSQLNDVDTLVREAAVLSLGVLGSELALRELAAQAKRADEWPRELAVLGLACQGPSALAQFTSDKSAKVRGAAALSVRRRPGAMASRVLRDLLIDPSLDVQMACIQSLHDWSDDLATPLLLESLAGSSFKARQAALKELEERRGGGLAFPLLAGPQERALRVQQWSRDWSIPDAAVERVHELTRQGSPLLDQARLSDLREKLQAAGSPASGDAIVLVAEWGGELTPADLPLVERLLADADALQTDLLLHHVLPRLGPAYAALMQLESGDAAVRREGASRIGRLGQEASLSPAVCRRLHELMRSEQDNLVWRMVMRGVYPDGSEEAGRLALLAINHSWPDVRILGCEYVGRHELPEQAVWLLPQFYDDNKAVQLAAVTAAGKCRNPVVLDGLTPAAGQAPLRGLRPLLTETQGQLQFAVVTSMARLGDAEAMQELVRLALDENSTSRLDVVQTMGETGQTRFVEPLIRLAWTEPNHHVRQAALANLQKLVPPADQPKALAGAKSIPQAVEIWVAWWEDRQTRRARL
jgi:HEAT repeat protein